VSATAFRKQAAYAVLASYGLAKNQIGPRSPDSASVQDAILDHLKLDPRNPNPEPSFSNVSGEGSDVVPSAD
jgi:hypothetical protein